MKKSIKIVTFLIVVTLLIIYLLPRTSTSIEIGVIEGPHGPTKIFLAGSTTSINPFLKYGLLIGVPCSLLLLFIKGKKGDE